MLIICKQSTTKISNPINIFQLYGMPHSLISTRKHMQIACLLVTKQTKKHVKKSKCGH